MMSTPRTSSPTAQPVSYRSGFFELWQRYLGAPICFTARLPRLGEEWTEAPLSCTDRDALDDSYLTVWHDHLDADRERYVRTSLQQSPWFSYIGSSHGYAWSRTPIRLKPEPGPKYHGNIWPRLQHWQPNAVQKTIGYPTLAPSLVSATSRCQATTSGGANWRHQCNWYRIRCAQVSL